MNKVLLHDTPNDKVRENASFFISRQKKVREKSGNFHSDCLHEP